MELPTNYKYIGSAAIGLLALTMTLGCGDSTPSESASGQQARAESEPVANPEPANPERAGREDIPGETGPEESPAPEERVAHETEAPIEREQETGPGRIPGFEQGTFTGFPPLDPPREVESEGEPAEHSHQPADLGHLVEGGSGTESEIEPGLTFIPDPAFEGDPVPIVEPEPPKPVDLGPPLVDAPEKLTRMDPKKPLWLDMANKRVVMVGQVCLREGGLEVFACLKGTKEHEAVVSVDIEAFKAHAGLLRVGAQSGSPARWEPSYSPARGSEIEITVLWKGKDGKVQSTRAQEWVYDAEKEQAIKHPWVFAGSGFWVEEETGKRHYQAEGGELICVSNFGSAMLDLPIESSQANASLMFQANTEKIPPLGTPVTLLLTPKKAEPPEEAAR